MIQLRAKSVHPAALLFFLTMTGMHFIPQTMIPLFVWPLLVGFCCLGLVMVHWIKLRTMPDNDLAPALTATFCLVLGAGLFFSRQRSGASFFMAFVALLVAGILWSVWKAFQKDGRS